MISCYRRGGQLRTAALELEQAMQADDTWFAREHESLKRDLQRLQADLCRDWTVRRAAVYVWLVEQACFYGGTIGERKEYGRADEQCNDFRFLPGHIQYIVVIDEGVSSWAFFHVYRFCATLGSSLRPNRAHPSSSEGNETRSSSETTATGTSAPVFRAVPAFELAILRAIFHSKGPKA
jgi:hypothetical protein